jgi:hypothetical protein
MPDMWDCLEGQNISTALLAPARKSVFGTGFWHWFVRYRMGRYGTEWGCPQVKNAQPRSVAFAWQARGPGFESPMLHPEF